MMRATVEVSVRGRVPAGVATVVVVVVLVLVNVAGHLLLGGLWLGPVVIVALVCFAHWSGLSGTVASVVGSSGCHAWLMSAVGCVAPSIAPSAFAGFRFPPEVIILAVRWYLRFGLSYRDVEELLAERAIEVDHVTIYRWVQRFTPLLIDAARPCRHAPGDRWFVDETSWESQGVAAWILRVEPAGCGLSRWRGDR
jgi:hypothetical protein